MTKKELEAKVQQLELELSFVKGQVQALQWNKTYHPAPQTTPYTPVPWTVTC